MAGASSAEVAILLKAQDQASAAIQKVSGELGKLGEAGSGIGSKLAGAGAALATLATGAAVGGLAALGAGLATAVTSASDFEKQMSAIGAVSGASASEMAQLQQAALDLGAKTSFSASEAANGIEELVKAGVKIGDVLGGGAAAALDLAAAGGIKVGEAAEIASNAMNVFGLKGSDMAHVADVIAGAANASAISVTDYKFSLAAAGAVAATVGVSFDDLSTAIAVMGNAGIKGSDAGTSLKTFLMNLTPSSKAATNAMRELGIITKDGANQFFDASGKAKSMAEIAGVLQKATKGLTEQQKLQYLQTIFGSDAIRAAAVIAEAGASGFDDLAASIAKVTASEVAAKRLDNLKGALEQLRGSLETAAITVGLKLLPALTQLTLWATEKVNAALPALEAFGQTIADAFETIKQALSGDWSPDASINPIVNAIGRVALGIRELSIAWGQGWDAVLAVLAKAGAAILTQLAQWGQAFVDWVTPYIGPMLATLGTLALALGAWLIETALPAIVEQLAQWGAAFIAWIGPQIPGMLEALGAILVAIGGWIVDTALPAIIAQLVTWGTAFIEWVAPQIPGMVAALVALGAALLAWIGEQIPPLIAALVKWGEEFINWVAPQVPGMIEALGKLASQFLDWLIAQVPTITAALVKWAILFEAWILTDAVPRLIKALPEILITLTRWQASATLEIIRLMTALGVAIVQGIWQGFQSAWGDIASRIKSAVGGLQLSVPIRVTTSGGGLTNGYANGGMLTEPIVGYGLRTGERYTFAENGPEMVTPMRDISSLGLGSGGGRAAVAAGGSSYTINATGYGAEEVAGGIVRELRIREMLQGVYV